MGTIDRARHSRHPVPMSNATRMQRVLIADDDPVSLRFLAAAVSQLGCHVVTVADGDAALAAAQTRPFDLMLLDLRMPGLGGVELLLALRASGDLTPAIATSAEVDASISAQLQQVGFLGIIEKPATLATLERALSPHLYFSQNLNSPSTARVATPLLDDSAALSAIGGDTDSLRALRDLLATELDALLSQQASATSEMDSAGWRERMHRLRASCGFCGATALAEAALRLDRALRDDPANARFVLGSFLDSCRTTLSVLRGQEPSAMDGARTSPSIPQARKPAPSR
jgi:two-component system OmpR family response regulator